MSEINNTISILALRELKGVGAVAIKKLWLQNVFDNNNLYNTIEMAIKVLKKNLTDTEVEELVEKAKETVLKNAEDDIKVIDISHEKYPSQLKEINGPPSILYYKGNIEKSTRTIGIVGTREPSTKSLEIAKRIGVYFSEKGYSICNGLAIGIDEASIKSDFGVQSNVVGVLAGGLNYNKTKTLLKSTAQLAEQVLESGGLILSEYTCGTKEDTFKVIDSCALQAYMSHGLILIQSKSTGGSKYTLEAFAELNRPFGVINLPEIELDPTFEANSMLLKNTKKALSEITNIKLDKIKIEKCISISQRGDYIIFEEAMVKSIKSGLNKDSLF